MTETEAQPEYYLILHKVRGAPAFDIAYKMRIANEDGWLTPTSGHRAYPYGQWPLNQFFSTSELNEHLFNPCPVSTPDHYASNDNGRAVGGTTLADLGLD